MIGRRCSIELEVLDQEKPIDLESQDQNEEIKIDLEELRLVIINDYEELKNIPMINRVQLIGNKTAEELGLEPETEVISMLDIYKIFQRSRTQ